jgi:SpoVK/Ycf46/Vps4 family AAA+-type ATPase
VSASSSVIQLVRAHYSGDERQFASSALSLAAGSKVWSVRRNIEDAVRSGVQRAVNKPRQTQELRPVKLLAGGMLEELEPVTLAELELPAALAASIEEITTELEYREELGERGLRPRNRVLLWGPPGCGKTSVARAMGSALDVPAYGVSLPRVIDKYIGATGQNLGELFSNIQDDTLVVLDEIDALGATRGGVDHSAGKEFNGIVNTMLTLLDRCHRGIIVATTNRPDIVDPALLRRFDEQFEVPEPTIEQMAALAVRLCDGFKIPEVPVDGCRNYDDVTKQVQREARRIVMAEILAAEELSEDGEEKSAE